VGSDINNMFVDIENSLGIDAALAVAFFEAEYGSLSEKRAFLADRNRCQYGQQWENEGFQVQRCGDDPDAADLRLINAILQILDLTVSTGRQPGVLCIVTNGDAIYRNVIRNAKRHGWNVVILSWGGLRGRLKKFIDAHHDMRVLA
jgi:hypothetical protein